MFCDQWGRHLNQKLYQLIVPQVPKVLKKHLVFLCFGAACAKTIENGCFFLLLECLWESIGLRRSFHNLGGQKKSKKIDAFCNFFSPAGLGLGSGWVGHFKSEGFV